MIGDQHPKIEMFLDVQDGVLSPQSKDKIGSKSPVTKSSSRIAEKYGLRPRTIIKRIQLERNRKDPPPTTKKGSRKSKKPPPLSKYRRKTANARERHRMKEINEAFATLKGILPNANARRPTSNGMTKITTLRHATSYIKALADVLNTEEEPLSANIHMNVSRSMVFSQQSCARMFHLEDNKDVLRSECNDVLCDSNIENVIRRSCNDVLRGSCISGDEYQSYHSSSRGSLSSNSEIGDLLSDDSCVFEDNLDAFDDIPALSEPDPFALLLAGEHSDLSIGS